MNSKTARSLRQYADRASAGDPVAANVFYNALKKRWSKTPHDKRQLLVEELRKQLSEPRSNLSPTNG